MAFQADPGAARQGTINTYQQRRPKEAVSLSLVESRKHHHAAHARGFVAWQRARANASSEGLIWRDLPVDAGRSRDSDRFGAGGADDMMYVGSDPCCEILILFCI